MVSMFISERDAKSAAPGASRRYCLSFGCRNGVAPASCRRCSAVCRPQRSDEGRRDSGATLPKLRHYGHRLFLLALLVALATRICFGQAQPAFENVRIGAFDAEAWNGVVFLARAFQQPAVFAMRIGSQRGGGFLDGNEIFDAVSQVGPYAPDASYCRMAWRQPPSESQVVLEWSRLNETTVVGRLTTSSESRLVLEGYFPGSSNWGSQGFYHVDAKDESILGQRFFDQVYGPTAQFVVMVDRPLLGSGTYPSVVQLGEDMRGSGRLTSSLAGQPNDGAAGIEFITGSSGTAHFVAKIGWDRTTLLSQAHELLQDEKIDSILREKSAAYAQRRPRATGLFSGAARAIGNSMFWNSLYAPSDNLIFPSISRHWAHGWGGWVIGEWDCFFGALLTSLEDATQTEAGVKAILLAQTSSGLVPNMASGSGTTPDRSEPPVGAYCVWKIYQRLGDRSLLEWAYPRLKRWHERWSGNRGDGQRWRDGNRDGLLEWGSDRGSAPSVGGRGFLQAAKWESGMDDSPMWDHTTYDPHTYTMDLDDVGLNSLYALDAECLSKIALILGNDADARQLSAEYTRMKDLVQTKLWNPAAGIYENRYWDGHFSKRLSPTNFYPLFAGIATPEQAERMVKEHLLNPKEFWGKYVIPTIARNDPAFADQFYWRGDIWGPTNYMVYEGLDRYGFDQVALEYAQKNYDLYMDDWKRNQHDDEQYHAWGGNGGGDTHYTWGALLCLVGLEQYIDVNPWDGLRFGALDPSAPGEFRGAKWQGHDYEVSIAPTQTKLVRDGTARFEANRGVVVRNYAAGPSAVSFTIHSQESAQVTTEEFASGTLRLKIDGKDMGRIAVLSGRARFTVPAGVRKVELQK
jgi:Mannosylglycerate hydrolase MGH1-like glycoside hydrolase domain